MAGILRHYPEQYNIELDSNGWCSIAQLAHAMGITQLVIEQIVATDDKERYQINKATRMVRAVQGHSTPQVDVQFEPILPPAVLYHGTSTRYLDVVMDDGIKPMSRHYVHLSSDYDTAIDVGARHGKVAVLEIDTATMAVDGLRFYQADNGVWLTKHVPPKYIKSTTYPN